MQTGYRRAKTESLGHTTVQEHIVLQETYQPETIHTLFV
jgi:hypothetical protein